MTENQITRERWRRIEAVLDEALELPAEEVPAFLDRACSGDEALRAEVEALLHADRGAGGFLETPAADLVSTLADDREDNSPAARLEGRSIGPYHIVRRIGAGGMGVVYLARDERLQRTVALKLLPVDWGGGIASRDRFLREARLVSALDHPNICTLHDIGETDDGRLYLVMGYYQGETLREKLDRGPLPVTEAVDLAIQVGRGLARAHEAGIIHRDIKPANVIVTEHGEAKILDFGIAKGTGEAGLTRPGSSLGTPAYMSPEQAAGRPVDARTDVWSLGVMLYEMIAGRRPFTGENAQAQIHAILERQPEPLSQGRPRPDVPAVLVRAVQKALAKDPGQRYPSVNEFIAHLTAGTGPHALAAAVHRRHWWTLAAAGLLVVALVGLASWWGLRGSRGRAATGAGAEAPANPEGPAAVPVVGVLPFANRTGDATLDWYGEGVARLVRDSLSSSRHLQVASAARADPLATVAGEAERTRRAAKDGITVLLSGEILPGKQGFILAARCVETGSGRQLAASRFDGLTPKDLLQASDEIALRARKGLNVPPAEAVDVFTADFAAENPQAYEAYVIGLRAFSAKKYDEAERAFSRALEQAPGFTMARYRLAHTLAATSRTDEALTEIRQALSEADRLPDREARYVRALEAYISRRYEDAIQAYRGITERFPYESEAHYFLAILLKSTRRYDQALAHISILLRLEPDEPSLWDLSGETHLAQGNLYQAVQDFERFLALDPGSAEGHKLLGDAYRAQGELALAADSYTKALDLDPQLHSATVAMAVTDALRGERPAAEKRLGALVTNTAAAPRDRLDALFELASLLRSEGRFRRAVKTLASLEDLLAAEKVREALALSIRGTSLLELGEPSSARPLLEEAVRRSPPSKPPTRYLFARGLLEIHERGAGDLERTVGQIAELALPANDPDRTEEKAAACLRGMEDLAAGRPQEAIAEFSKAVSLEGEEYVSYRLWLARAYVAAGRLPEALAAAHEAARPTGQVKPRLDLELDRVRALLVLAQAHKAMGRPAEASALARQFLERWQGADSNLPDLVVARRLAAG
ncbi:MAG TPA: tetratricopeptide repeat protein [Thermoanaerobaculia bacterium]